MVEYWDRLDADKKRQLRDNYGGELGWKKTFPRLSKDDKLQFGEIVFGVPVNKVWIAYERNQATGYDLPVIFADAK